MLAAGVKLDISDLVRNTGRSLSSRRVLEGREGGRVAPSRCQVPGTRQGGRCHTQPPARNQLGHANLRVLSLGIGNNQNVKLETNVDL